MSFVAGQVFAQLTSSHLIHLRTKNGTLVVDENGLVKLRSEAWLIERFHDDCECAWALSRGKGWGVIDINGKWILRPHFGAFPEEGDGFAIVATGHSDAKVRFISMAGRYLKGTYEGAHPFSESLAAVKIEGKWGYINLDGKTVIPAVYDDAMPFSSGLGLVVLNGRQIFLRKDGSRALAIPRDVNAGPFKEDRAVFEENGLKGIIDRSGARILNATYPDISAFSDGFAAFKTEAGEWGFLDLDGSPKIPAAFLAVSNFSEGLAAVKTLDGKWGFIGQNGQFAVPAIYTETPGDFSNGLAYVTLPDRSSEGEYAFIDKQGRVRFTEADVMKQLPKLDVR